MKQLLWHNGKTFQLLESLTGEEIETKGKKFLAKKAGDEVKKILNVETIPKQLTSVFFFDIEDGFELDDSTDQIEDIKAMFNCVYGRMKDLKGDQTQVNDDERTLIDKAVTEYVKEHPNDKVTFGDDVE